MDKKEQENQSYEHGRDYSNHTSKHSNSYVDESINFADVSDMPRENISNHDSTINSSYYSYGSNPNSAGNGESQPPKKNQKNDKFLKILAVILVFGLVAGGTFAGTNYLINQTAAMANGSIVESDDENSDEKDSDESEDADKNENKKDAKTAASYGAVTDVSEVASLVMPAIVSITNVGTTEVSNFFGQTSQYESESAGSGIIIGQDSKTLYIVTNNHVVADSTSLTVSFVNDTTVSAEIKGTDEATDLAVITVLLSSLDEETTSAIRTATFGDSDLLEVGQSSIAIGNALGYGQSVTTGVISAVNREVTVQSETDGSAITNLLLQTDAAINPGNSGGALINLKGEVIGINSVKYSDTAVEGMGYAIPVSKAIPIIEQLITREEVTGADSAYFGISGVDVTSDVSGTYSMPQGVYVATVVDGSAADQAGVIKGDIISGFDGRTIISMSQMQDLLKYYSAGSTVEITVKRASNGEYKDVSLSVTLGKK